jgi:deoxyribonuclease-1-like protein
MAKRMLLALAVVAAAAGGYAWYALHFETHYEDGKLAYVKVVPRGRAGEPSSSPGPTADLPPPKAAATIRIATFHLDGLDEQKLRSPRVADVLARVLGRFDLVALQGLRGRGDAVLVRLVEAVNAKSGGRYDFATAPLPASPGEQILSAFVFDRAAVEVDRRAVYLVEDPQGRFTQPPLVGLFRARGPDPAEAFTLKLIGVRTDPRRAAEELDLLADVFLAVRDDGSGEDDVILLGNLGADEQNLGRLGRLLDVTAALAATPTTVRGTRRTTNILFDRRATVEFTGRAEVFDLMREFALSIEEAEEVSEHLPVWAEFSVFEGGRSGFVAGGAAPAARGDREIGR